jgi:hypothetical protein
MSDDALAASDAATDGVVQAAAGAAVSAPVAEQGAAIPSTRQALERAMASVDGAAPAGPDVPAEAAPAQSALPAVPAGPAPETIPPAPQRFARAAQEAWAQTPEPVRAEVERALGELTAGLEKYREAASAFQPLQRFDALARASGTTLEEALTHFVGIDQLLRQDALAGTMQIWTNLGLDPRRMVAALVQQVQSQAAPNGVAPGAPAASAAPLAPGVPGAAPAAGDAPEVAALRHEIAALKAELRNEVGSVRESVARREREAVQRAAGEAVQAFAAAHPYFSDLSDTIVRMIDTGFASDLSDAYEKAVRLSPDVAARIEADRKAKSPDPAQTRQKAQFSITGTPAAGSHPMARKAAGSIREALTHAASQVGLAP